MPCPNHIKFHEDSYTNIGDELVNEMMPVSFCDKIQLIISDPNACENCDGKNGECCLEKIIPAI